MRHAGTSPSAGERGAPLPGAVPGAACLRLSSSPLLALSLAVLLGSACASEGPRPIRPVDDLHDPNPSVRSQAVSEAARRGDDVLVPELIELLDDEDGAVRLVAGQALRDLTGRDSGYRAYAPPPELHRQVQDWRAWWASRTGSAAPVAPAAAAAPPAPRSSP